MLPISAEAAAVMAGPAFTMVSAVSSWKHGQLLAENIPFSSGWERVDVTSNVPESLELTVPRLDRGTSWVPGTDQDHPLACWGQRLHVSVGVGVKSGFETWARGWYYITDAEAHGDDITVTASGLLGLIQEAELVAPYGPAGNISTVLRFLIEPALIVDLTHAPADRAVPGGVVWQSDRLGAVYELLDAWGAEAYVNEDGALKVVPAKDTGTSQIGLYDGRGGTIVTPSASVSREGAANCVVARGYTDDGSDVQAVAYNLDPNSPTYYGGDFAVLPVPFVYDSALLTTVDQCQTTANTILRRRVAQASRAVNIEAVPNLALQARDGVTVTSDKLNVPATFGIVDQLDMPLTAADGAMTATVRLP